jgi:choline dehydrogenase
MAPRLALWGLRREPCQGEHVKGATGLALRLRWHHHVRMTISVQGDHAVTSGPRQCETVVVGAGASGSVVAARLTEAAGREVLLIEAGPDYADPASLPKDLADGRRNSMRRHDWGFKHRPTTEQMRFPLPRGRVVGGSSAVNTCLALRGQPGDYDEWAALGLDEWSWEQCLPAFKRLEHDRDFPDADWHGGTGPLPVLRETEPAPWQAAFLQACSEVGYPEAPDSNRPAAYGAGPHAVNRVDGRRISAAEAWLTAGVRARDGFALQANTEVHRVLIERGRVRAVEVWSGKALQRVEAERVVLCAGAIKTPEILMRSGVGPRAALERLGVACVMDSPGVGARLLDHPGVAFFMRPRWGRSHRQAPLIQSVLRHLLRPGELHSYVQIQAGSSVPFPGMNLPLFSIMAGLGKPAGHGTIQWASLARGAKPVIHSRFLDDERDRALAVEALWIGLELAQSEPLRSMATPLWPGRRALKRREDIAGWIRKFCDSGYHPSGTAPMGPDGDPMAVCDGRGRVRGVTGLYVADASLMPTIPTSNTHLPTLMIGERMGAWLRTLDT